MPTNSLASLMQFANGGAAGRSSSGASLMTPPDFTAGTQGFTSALSSLMKLELERQKMEAAAARAAAKAAENAPAATIDGKEGGLLDGGTGDNPVYKGKVPKGLISMRGADGRWRGFLGRDKNDVKAEMAKINADILKAKSGSLIEKNKPLKDAIGRINAPNASVASQTKALDDARAAMADMPAEEAAAIMSSVLDPLQKENAKKRAAIERDSGTTAVWDTLSAAASKTASAAKLLFTAHTPDEQIGVAKEALENQRKTIENNAYLREQEALRAEGEGVFGRASASTGHYATNILTSGAELLGDVVANQAIPAAIGTAAGMATTTGVGAPVGIALGTLAASQSGRLDYLMRLASDPNLTDDQKREAAAGWGQYGTGAVNAAAWQLIPGGKYVRGLMRGAVAPAAANTAGAVALNKALTWNNRSAVSRLGRSYVKSSGELAGIVGGSHVAGNTIYNSTTGQDGSVLEGLPEAIGQAAILGGAFAPFGMRKRRTGTIDSIFETDANTGKAPLNPGVTIDGSGRAKIAGPVVKPTDSSVAAASTASGVSLSAEETKLLQGAKIAKEAEDKAKRAQQRTDVSFTPPTPEEQAEIDAKRVLYNSEDLRNASIELSAGLETAAAKLNRSGKKTAAGKYGGTMAPSSESVAEFKAEVDQAVAHYLTDANIAGPDAITHLNEYVKSLDEHFGANNKAARQRNAAWNSYAAAEAAGKNMRNFKVRISYLRDELLPRLQTPEGLESFIAEMEHRNQPVQPAAPESTAPSRTSAPAEAAPSRAEAPAQPEPVAVEQPSGPDIPAPIHVEPPSTYPTKLSAMRSQGWTLDQLKAAAKHGILLTKNGKPVNNMKKLESDYASDQGNYMFDSKAYKEFTERPMQEPTQPVQEQPAQKQAETAPMETVSESAPMDSAEPVEDAKPEETTPAAPAPKKKSRGTNKKQNENQYSLLDLLPAKDSTNAEEVTVRNQEGTTGGSPIEGKDSELGEPVNEAEGRSDTVDTESDSGMETGGTPASGPASAEPSEQAPRSDTGDTGEGSGRTAVQSSGPDQNPEAEIEQARAPRDGEGADTGSGAEPAAEVNAESGEGAGSGAGEAVGDAGGAGDAADAGGTAVEARVAALHKSDPRATSNLAERLSAMTVLDDTIGEFNPDAGVYLSIVDGKARASARKKLEKTRNRDNEFVGKAVQWGLDLIDSYSELDARAKVENHVGMDGVVDAEPTKLSAPLDPSPVPTPATRSRKRRVVTDVTVEPPEPATKETETFDTVSDVPMDLSNNNVRSRFRNGLKAILESGLKLAEKHADDPVVSAAVHASSLDLLRKSLVGDLGRYLSNADGFGEKRATSMIRYILSGKERSIDREMFDKHSYDAVMGTTSRSGSEAALRDSLRSITDATRNNLIQQIRRRARAVAEKILTTEDGRTPAQRRDRVLKEFSAIVEDITGKSHGALMAKELKDSRIIKHESSFYSQLQKLVDAAARDLEEKSAVYDAIDDLSKELGSIRSKPDAAKQATAPTPESVTNAALEAGSMDALGDAISALYGIDEVAATMTNSAGKSLSDLFSIKDTKKARANAASGKNELSLNLFGERPTLDTFQKLQTALDRSLSMRDSIAEAYRQVLSKLGVDTSDLSEMTGRKLTGLMTADKLRSAGVEDRLLYHDAKFADYVASLLNGDDNATNNAITKLKDRYYCQA